MDSKSSYSLTEIRDAMRARVPQGVGMGRENVFMTTEYGDVVITDRYVLFPGNPYKFARRRKSLADYCDFIIGGIEPYSSPDVRNTLSALERCGNVCWQRRIIEDIRSR